MIHLNWRINMEKLLRACGIASGVARMSGKQITNFTKAQCEQIIKDAFPENGIQFDIRIVPNEVEYSISELDNELQEILKLLYSEGLSIEDVSLKLNTSLQKVCELKELALQEVRRFDFKLEHTPNTETSVQFPCIKCGRALQDLIAHNNRTNLIECYTCCTRNIYIPVDDSVLRYNGGINKRLKYDIDHGLI